MGCCFSRRKSPRTRRAGSHSASTPAPNTVVAGASPQYISASTGSEIQRGMSHLQPGTSVGGAIPVGASTKPQKVRNSAKDRANSGSGSQRNTPANSSKSKEQKSDSGTQPLPHRFSVGELRDGLLSTDDQRSANVDALDCTHRLSKRTEPKRTGGFSDVSQAWLGDLLVAVKELRATNIDGSDEVRMRKRLGREIYIWAPLHHPYILEFLGFAAFENGKPCLISPWCEYGTLQEYLQKYHGADRRLLVHQIAEGLKYLHVQDPPVIHGDFKTANILITDKHIPKICDFGGSNHLGERGTGFTTAGFSTTIRYTAPEILLEGQHHTLESDVYSFGCVALETMTNKCPFWRIPKSVAVINKVVHEKQTPSPDDHPELEDDKLWELLQQCWSNKPSDRPTMITVCRELAKEGHAFYPTEFG